MWIWLINFRYSNTTPSVVCEDDGVFFTHTLMCCNFFTFPYTLFAFYLYLCKKKLQNDP